MNDELGRRGNPEPPKSDGPFRRAMRRQQNKWRETQELSYATDNHAYGNLLTTTDGDAGKNFSSPEIFGLVEKRIADGPGVEPNRCKYNLLSSQPMAFNLFGPLCLDPELAQYLLHPLLPGGVNKASVTIEWAPSPREEYLKDHTSFDVAIWYTTAPVEHGPDGKSAFAGIEVKLSEPFSPQPYGSADGRYDAKCQDPNIWHNQDISILSASKFNQIWRTHMLAQAMQNAGDAILATAVILHHSGDTKCTEAVVDYKKLLQPHAQDTLLHCTIGKLVAQWSGLLAARPNIDRTWLDWFMNRYPDPLPEPLA